jgi:hypothetical protein
VLNFAKGVEGEDNESGLHDFQKYREGAQLPRIDDGQQVAQNYRYHPQGKHQGLGTNHCHQRYRCHSVKQYQSLELVW